MALAEISSVKHINDITECPICNEVFIDPRVLPCVHTFCFECIAKWAEDQATFDTFACPLCRKEHKIIGRLSSGIERIADLPKNSFVQKVVDARKRSTALSGTDVRCDVCCGDVDEETAATKKAVAYCVECCQNICEQCSMCHRKLKITCHHKLVELQENRPLHSELLLELPEDRCDKHDGEIIKLYCRDCKLPTCMMCIAADHEQHKFSDLKKFADEMRVQMRDDIAGISSKVDECRQRLSNLVNENPDLNDKIDAAARLVTETAEKMRQAVDDYKVKLLDELESVRATHEKKVESLRQDLEATLLTLEIFKHYSEQVEMKGTACDVVTSERRLHVRANELRTHKVSGDFKEEIWPDIKLKFSSEFSTDELHSLFGELCIEGSDANSSTSAELVGIIPITAGRHVTSVTSMGNEVFVVCHRAQQIDVYDARTLKWQRALANGRQKFVDGRLAACERNNYVYMSSCNPFLIRRIDLIACDRTSCWPTSRSPNGVAVTRDANVLVTFRTARMLQEFTTDGKLIRDIVLQADVTFPMHAVPLSGDRFGVTHTGSLHRFCVVGSDGCVVRSYGGAPGSGDRQLLMPHGITPTECDDQVFVADTENRRVLLLNLATLSAVQLRVDIGRKIGGPLTYLDSIHYDMSRSRLYIGERGGRCRVIVVTV